MNKSINKTNSFAILHDKQTIICNNRHTTDSQQCGLAISAAYGELNGNYVALPEVSHNIMSFFCMVF